jgi:hypothetical protein
MSVSPRWQAAVESEDPIAMLALCVVRQLARLSGRYMLPRLLLGWPLCPNCMLQEALHALLLLGFADCVMHIASVVLLSSSFLHDCMSP